jgi:hypothetical protein
MFSDDEVVTDGKKKEPRLGYCYCLFTISMFILLSIFVAC